MKFAYLRVLLVLLFFLSACDQVQPTAIVQSPSGQTPSGATPPAAPEADKATVVGRVLSSVDGKPIPQIAVRLAEVYRQPGKDPFYILNLATSPGDRTDDEGVFLFENIPAGEYVILVGEAYGMRRAVIDEATGKPRLWKMEAGKVLDTGTVSVDWE
jgi:hypothetical protein